MLLAACQKCFVVYCKDLNIFKKGKKYRRKAHSQSENIYSLDALSPFGESLGIHRQSVNRHNRNMKSFMSIFIHNYIYGIV